MIRTGNINEVRYVHVHVPWSAIGIVAYWTVIVLAGVLW